MIAPSTAKSASIIAVIGASGMGKGLYVKELLAKRGARKVLVWSILEPTDQYATLLKCQAVDSIPGLVKAVKAKAKAIVYAPARSIDLKKQFDLFCRVAWELKGWIIVVEELSRVTMASWAPPAWKDLSTAGRHQGLLLIATAQRPSQVDKDFFGNCTEVRCYRVNYENDAKAMGSFLREPWAQLLELPDQQYIHRLVADRKNVTGTQKKPGE